MSVDADSDRKEVMTRYDVDLEDESEFIVPVETWGAVGGK